MGSWQLAPLAVSASLPTAPTPGPLSYAYWTFAVTDIFCLFLILSSLYIGHLFCLPGLPFSLCQSNEQLLFKMQTKSLTLMKPLFLWIFLEGLFLCSCPPSSVYYSVLLFCLLDHQCCLTVWVLLQPQSTEYFLTSVNWMGIMVLYGLFRSDLEEVSFCFHFFLYEFTRLSFIY